MKLYLIGGTIRDSILNLPVNDTDIVCINGTFDDMRVEILKRGGKIYIEKPEYLTIRCSIPSIKGGVDFSLARIDGQYFDGRHPDKVEVAGSLFQDLARRDYCFNAIAKDFDTGEIIDPHNGISDIKNKIIRAVGNPIERFQEDKLRIIRACRFAVQKKFTIEQNTLEAMYQFSSDDFKNVSSERLQQEFYKMFSCDTFLSIHYLFDKFPRLGHLMVERNIWLKPTLEERK